MILHIFSLPLSSYKLNELIIQQQDSILLTSDACYSAANFVSTFSNCKLYALETDIKARGVQTQHLELITDEQWVELIVQSKQHITW